MFFSKHNGLLIFLIPIFSGCVGVGVLYPKSEVITYKPKIASPDSGVPNTSTKCSMYINKHGEPRNLSINGNETTLVYKSDSIWVGIMPMIIIPIPLVLPLGSRKITILCRDDEIVQMILTTPGYASAYCGIISPGPVISAGEGKWGCKTD